MQALKLWIKIQVGTNQLTSVRRQAQVEEQLLQRL